MELDKLLRLPEHAVQLHQHRGNTCKIRGLGKLMKNVTKEKSRKKGVY
jgi:hypothetical protein